MMKYMIKNTIIGLGLLVLSFSVASTASATQIVINPCYPNGYTLDGCGGTPTYGSGGPNNLSGNQSNNNNNGGATSNGSTVFGNNNQQANLPTVVTVGVQSVDSNGATFLGTVVPNSSGNVAVRFEYGITSGLGNTTQTTYKSGITDFSASVTGLASGTTYFYRAVASSNTGTSYGMIRTLTTRSGVSNGGSVVSASTTTVRPTTTTTVRQIATTTNTTNNVITTTSEGVAATLSVSNNSDRVTSGSTLNYIINYKNTSGVTLENVTISVVFPAGIRPATTTAGVISTNGTIDATIGTLLPDQEGSIFASAVVDRTVRNGDSLITNATMTFNRGTRSSSEQVVGYTTNTIADVSDQSGNNLGALALFSGNFFPQTFWGWVLLIVLIVAIILVAERIYQGNKGGHVAHSDHILEPNVH